MYRHVMLRLCDERCSAGRVPSRLPHSLHIFQIIIPARVQVHRHKHKPIDRSKPQAEQEKCQGELELSADANACTSFSVPSHTRPWQARQRCGALEVSQESPPSEAAAVVMCLDLP